MYVENVIFSTIWHPFLSNTRSTGSTMACFCADVVHITVEQSWDCVNTHAISVEATQSNTITADRQGSQDLVLFSVCSNDSGTDSWKVRHYGLVHLQVKMSLHWIQLSMETFILVIYYLSGWLLNRFTMAKLKCLTSSNVKFLILAFLLTLNRRDVRFKLSQINLLYPINLRGNNFNTLTYVDSHSCAGCAPIIIRLAIIWAEKI